MDGVKNYDIRDILIKVSWSASITTEKYTRRYGGRFRVIVKKAYAIFTRDKIKSLMQPLRVGISIVMVSVGSNVHNRYAICY